MKNDSRAINALGYIYFHAPTTFEQDPAKVNLFGSVKQDMRQAYKHFKKAAGQGSINAKFNLGSLYLSGEKITLPKTEDGTSLEFSFSKAYEWFKQAAEKGHTLAAYNLAIMHFTGLGTY